jgi:hypothetical protein
MSATHTDPSLKEKAETAHYHPNLEGGAHLGQTDSDLEKENGGECKCALELSRLPSG